MAVSQLTNQTIAELIILGGMTLCALSVSQPRKRQPAAQVKICLGGCF